MIRSFSFILLAVFMVSSLNAGFLKRLAQKEMAGFYTTVGFPGEIDSVVLDPDGGCDAQFIFPSLDPLKAPLDDPANFLMNHAPCFWRIKQVGAQEHTAVIYFFELVRDPDGIAFKNDRCNPGCFLNAYIEGPMNRETGLYTFAEFFSFVDQNLDPIGLEDYTPVGEFFFSAGPGKAYFQSNRSLQRRSLDQIRQELIDQGAPLP